MTRMKITDDEPQLDILSNYISKKQQYDKLDKEVKELANIIKEQMKEQDVKQVESNGFKITRSESQRVSWNEEMLLDKVKEYNMDDLTIQVEQVNVPVLEQYIMDDIIDINDLKECQKVTNIVQLRMSKVKENINE